MNRIVLLAGLAVAMTGCGNWLVPQGGYGASNGNSNGRGYAQPIGNGGGGSSTSSGDGAPTGRGSSTTSSAPSGFVPSTITVHSDCPHTLPLFIGERPKWGSGTKTSISSNTTTTFGRHPDGTATVWIIDDSENGIASAHASPSTQRIEIGRNCTAISAQ
jgi:hypothetical protein